MPGKQASYLESLDMRPEGKACAFNVLVKLRNVPLNNRLADQEYWRWQFLNVKAYAGLAISQSLAHF